MFLPLLVAFFSKTGDGGSSLLIEERCQEREKNIVIRKQAKRKNLKEEKEYTRTVVFIHGNHLTFYSFLHPVCLVSFQPAHFLLKNLIYKSKKIEKDICV